MKGYLSKDSTCWDNSLTNGYIANLILLLIRDRKRTVIEMHCHQFVNVGTHYPSLLCYYAININYHIKERGQAKCCMVLLHGLLMDGSD